MSGACSEACGEVQLCYVTLRLHPWEEGSRSRHGVARGGEEGRGERAEVARFFLPFPLPPDINVIHCILPSSSSSSPSSF